METITAVKTTWRIDPTHTEVQFKVKHLVISTVTGFFKKFSGSIESENEDFDGAKVSFSLDVNSIDTNQVDRDNHLKSPDFFAAEQYPTIDFTGSLAKVKGSEYTLDGALTLHGITKAVVLNVDFGGTIIDPWGNKRSGFEVSGKLNRKDFGLTWDALTEAGGMVVSEEVKLHMNVELVRG